MSKGPLADKLIGTVMVFDADGDNQFHDKTQPIEITDRQDGEIELGFDLTIGRRKLRCYLRLKQNDLARELAGEGE